MLAAVEHVGYSTDIPPLSFGGTMSVDPTISEEHQQDEDLVNSEPALNPTAASTVLSGTDADRSVDAPDDAPEGSKFVERDFYNAFDGTRGRAGGVYLDMVERNRAEELRAKSEGREPDFDNPPAVAGTQLVVDAMRVDNTFSNPASTPVNPVKEVDPVSTATVDVGIAATEIDTDTLEQHLAEAEARNDAVNNEATGPTVEEGAQPANPDNVQSVSQPTNVETTSSGETYSY